VNQSANQAKERNVKICNICDEEIYDDADCHKDGDDFMYGCCMERLINNSISYDDDDVLFCEYCGIHLLGSVVCTVCSGATQRSTVMPATVSL